MNRVKREINRKEVCAHTEKFSLVDNTQRDYALRLGTRSYGTRDLFEIIMRVFQQEEFLCVGS